MGKKHLFFLILYMVVGVPDDAALYRGCSLDPGGQPPHEPVLVGKHPVCHLGDAVLGVCQVGIDQQGESEHRCAQCAQRQIGQRRPVP